MNYLRKIFLIWKIIFFSFKNFEKRSYPNFFGRFYLGGEVALLKRPEVRPSSSYKV